QSLRARTTSRSSTCSNISPLRRTRMSFVSFSNQERSRMFRIGWQLSVALGLALFLSPPAQGDELARKDAAHNHAAPHQHGKAGGPVVDAPLVRSTQSGAWSDKGTWDLGRVPQKGDRVLIRPGHVVNYD